MYEYTSEQTELIKIKGIICAGKEQILSARQLRTFAHITKDHKGLRAVRPDGVDAANPHSALKQLAAV